MILADMADVVLVVGAPTPRPRASSLRTRENAGPTRTGCASDSWVAPTPRTSPSMPADGWISTAPRKRISPAVKVKNARHGMANPNARYHKEFTQEQVLEPLPWWPIRFVLLEICATSDGAAAVVVSSMEYARKMKRRSGEDPGGLHRHPGLSPEHRGDALFRHGLGRRRSRAGPRLQGIHCPRRVRRSRTRPGRHVPGRSL